jgi:hypothetical protein
MNYVIDETGRFVGAFDDASLPDGAKTVPSAPDNAGSLWDFDAEVWRSESLAPEQIIEAMRAAIQEHMDSAAKGYGYDDVKAAVTYAEEPAVARFQAEGRAFRAWRSLVWAHAYGVLDKVQAGQRPQPTAEELLAELPALEVAYGD